MTKILWADDQQDVIQTFSSILSPLSAQIIWAQNGVEAIEKLQSQYFDIVILDLMMPPEKWGGLWFLQEVQKLKFRVPILVLSGEGTQTETIKALRLGAHDYITKDKVKNELLERVLTVISEGDKDKESELAISFPTPLAIPYKRYKSTTNPVSQVHRLIEFFETTLRFTCIVGIAECVSNTLDSQILTKILPNPSMGTWNQLRMELSRILKNHKVFRQLNSGLEDFAVNKIIKLRNDIAHGTEPSERAAVAYLEEYSVYLKDTVNKIFQVFRFELVQPRNLTFDGSGFDVTGHILRGDSLSLPMFTTKVSNPIICDRIYLRSVDENVQDWVNLYPFVVTEPAYEPNTWDILIFDGIKSDSGHKNDANNERIRYIDLRAGRRDVILTNQPIRQSLPGFMRFNSRK